jgi:hypothetical protein
VLLPSVHHGSQTACALLNTPSAAPPNRPPLTPLPPPGPPAGKYALPWDMTTSGHRQFNPLFMLQRGISFVSEATDTLRRRWVGRLSGRCCGAVGRWTGGQVDRWYGTR